LLAFSPASRHTVASAKGIRASQPVTPAARGRVQAHFAALPLAFEENKGQTDAQVEYMARGNGYTLFLTANDAVFSLHSASAASKISTIRSGTQLRANNLPKQSNTQESTAAVRMQLAGGNAQAKISASGQLPGKSNYFIGNDPSKWQTDVAHYARVSYQDVYPGINLAFHGAQRQVEFDFVVAAGANPAPIGFHFTGVQNIKTDDSGNLVVSSAAGEVLLHKPVAYQEQNGARQPIDAQFILKANNQVSFDLGNYDHNRELVIDPSVSYEYSTYLGGSGDDEGEAITFDSGGNAYVTGNTQSANFPGFSSTNKLVGVTNVFVTKIKADGSGLIYSVYIGGSGNDNGNGIAVNSSGDAFVVGATTSSNFPHTTGAFQTALAIGATGNAFVSKLNPTGGIVYSTYLGGNGADAALGMALDSGGNVYAVGATSSTNFPTTASPLQASAGGGFVSKLSPLGNGASDLVYSSYLGGIGDSVAGAALDSSDDLFVTGQTSDSSFHTTTGAYQTVYGGGSSDAFVTVINPAGNGFVYSTFLGGSGLDAGGGIAVDATGNAYITGLTESTNFPVSSSSYQKTNAGGNSDAFVTKLTPAGNGAADLVYSTYLGGSGADFGASIAVDGSNNAYVTGQTDSANFPTASATQPSLGGSKDAFVTELNSAGSQLVFSTYLGGSADEDDAGNFGAIAVDVPGDSIYVTGNTASTDFPTQAPYPYAGGNANAGGNDAFVVKYAQPAFSLTATAPAAVSAGASSTSTVTLTSFNGYSSPVTLSCTVTGTGSPLPGCSVTGTNPQTPTPGGAISTVTITTTGPGGSLLRPGKFFYAIWLPIAGLSLAGMGFSTSRPRRKQMFGLLILGMVLTGLLLMPACGGGSSTTPPPTCATAPTVPTGLAASGTTSTATTLNWTASTVGANCSVTKYTVYQNGTAIGSPTTNTLNVTGLTPSTQYSFTVSATDSAGASAQSSALSVTTGSGATPSGSYTITITGTDASNRSQSSQVTLTVN
jgi:hypothetical protein